MVDNAGSDRNKDERAMTTPDINMGNLGEWIINTLQGYGISCTEEEAAEFAKGFEEQMDKQMVPVLKRELSKAYNSGIDAAVETAARFGVPALTVLRMQANKMHQEDWDGNEGTSDH
jgi:hypothetical protein